MEKKNYSYDEAYGESLKYFQGDELAARVWVNKYAVKDSFGNIYEKSPEDMHWRIANEVARIEAKYPNPLSSEELFGLLDHFKYIVPQGSPMTGIGNNYQVASLSNCFVIGVDGEADSYGAIFKIDVAFQCFQSRTTNDRSVVAREVVLRQKFTNFHFNQFQQLFVINVLPPVIPITDFTKHL